MRFYFLLALFQILLLNKVQSFSFQRLLKSHHRYTSQLHVTNEINKDEGLINALESIIRAVDEGREDEIEGNVPGIKVRRLQKLTPQQELYENLNDPQVRARITDPEDFEEVTLMMQLNEEMRRARKYLESSTVATSSSSQIIDSKTESFAQAVKAEVEGLRVSMEDEMDRLDGNIEINADIAASDVGVFVSTTVQSTPASVALDNLLLQKGSLTTSSSSSITSSQEDKNKDKFTELLRSAMNDQSASAEDAPLQLKQATVAAVEAGNFNNLDLGSLLGEALSTLSGEMGLDIKQELSADSDALQGMMQESVSELAANMRELDAKNKELFDRLGRLEIELREETEKFDEQKSAELGDLLDDQNRLRQELSVSQENMKQSTIKMNKIMDSYEQDADFLTSLAMFPFKSKDKKFAFVIGLAMLFKVPFDISVLFAVRGADSTELFSLFTQTLLGLTCFYHYGLLQAMTRKPMDI